MFTNRRTIIITTALAGLLVLGCGSLPATARQDAGPVVVHTIPDDGHCSLARVGTQFVKCDDLTGNGVSAPSWIPVA